MFKTQQSLIEQMRISDADIHHRQQLVGIDGESIIALRNVLNIISDSVDDIVEQFYELQLSIDEIAILIGDADTLFRLKSAQRQYILDLFEAKLDSEYVNNRLRIGLVHKRIGVEPKLYLSGINTLKHLLFKVIDKHVSDTEASRTIKYVLDRLFYFDTTLVFDTYIESLLREVDVAKRKTEDYANSLEIKVAERTAQLEEMSKHDPLTGLFNQTEMRSLLQRSLNMLKRREGNISLAFFDVDDFKMVNDTYGHIAGDNILKALASSIQKHIRESDIACRYGGDEFCVIFLDATAQEAIDICHRVMQDFQLNPHQVNVSYGIAEMNSDNLMEADHFIGLADKAMYSAKEQKGIGT